MQPVLRRPSLRDHLRTETMLAPVPVAGPPGPRARLPAAGIVRDICQIPLQQAKLSMNLNTRQDIEGGKLLSQIVAIYSQFKPWAPASQLASS
jgi:hypothetical protein